MTMRWLSMSLTFRRVSSASAHSRGVERHQQDALVGENQLLRRSAVREFLLAEDRREAMCLFRVESFGNAQGPP